MSTKTDALWLRELHKFLLRQCRASEDRDGWMEGPARAGLYVEFAEEYDLREVE